MYFFEDLEKQKRLLVILESWVGTPYRHHCGVKGLGADCIHFVAKVLEEMGVLKWRKNLIPDYPRDWHMHNTRELLSEGILKELKVEKIGLENRLNGDIILSHYGKAASHASIFFDGYVYQAIDDIGVCRVNFNDRVFFKKQKFAYRIVS